MAAVPSLELSISKKAEISAALMLKYVTLLLNGKNMTYLRYLFGAFICGKLPFCDKWR